MQPSTYSLLTSPLPGPATLKRQPIDFQVTELMGFEPDGSPPHHWYWVQKEGANTEWVAKQFARVLDVSNREVGFSGMKDRHAVTQQWFSTPAALPDELEIEGVEILRRAQHSKKLKRGWHRGNQFQIKLYTEAPVDPEALEALVAQINTSGFANYFGEQRFGRNNLERFHSLKKRDVKKNGILLSSARAWVFNRLLDQRISQGRLAIEAGDRVCLSGSASHFVASVEELDTLHARQKAGDVSLGLSLPGKSSDGSAAMDDECRDIEAKLTSFGVEQGYRPAICRPQALSASVMDNEIELLFSLPSGAYATVLLAHLINLVES
ncbi:MAG: tRNA pseudouridine(13) synthase TruD [Gammaproteobacteria bacterium]|nr:tRNA pseudouridine(13) synthase TruD [Gammaproteobacteria bacterium]